jgi:hypothetical protein
MVWVFWVVFSQKLHTIYELGHPSGDMVIAVEADGTICDSFGPGYESGHMKQ